MSAEASAAGAADAAQEQGMTEEQLRKAEKERRRREFEAKNKDKLTSKPKLSKKERREKQEREKAAKQQAATAGKGKAGGAGKNAGPVSSQSRPPVPRPNASDVGKADVGANPQKLSSAFAHLAPFRAETNSATMGLDLGEHNNVHPAVIAVGLKFANGELRGANTRMASMMQAFKETIADYERPENASVARDLTGRLDPMIQFLNKCRPPSISMNNAIKHLLNGVSTLPPELSESEAKEQLLGLIDSYVHTNVTLAQEELVRVGLTKISKGDVVLTFSQTGAVEKLLLAAHERGTPFEVVVVSCRPEHDGEDLVKRLASAGISCVFIELSSLSYMMGSVTKVILGAAAMLSNGTLLGPAGTALVAMMAKSMHKPVLVCCESHKFSERVQLDSITHNELGNPDALVLADDWDGVEGRPSNLAGWHEDPNLELLNLRYDLTPQAHISALITEFGLVPVTSVPVIVREKEEVVVP
ncbi:Translation initiation factor eIF-2B subunit delta [Hondaea fermentalgiana]|uniref:Translation initiation factor eIF2B subunit delta n=1 Tax=Hondaea fermentalgiana TaxID=2315210 RepID=A0A2R5GAC4_9STRA|nr:Translation initiation factor eIF-2B subunit delta [Hondaea fermentalgiana]|eukprot:GBG27976.1 Translation initiation factor eIF-2B subunit delta [Hondaea fermentalgiana]